MEPHGEQRAEDGDGGEEQDGFRGGGGSGRRAMRARLARQHMRREERDAEHDGEHAQRLHDGDGREIGVRQLVGEDDHLREPAGHAA